MDSDKTKSVFWPILLIAVGAVWLLGNLSVFPAFNFLLLLRLWPVLLIVIGLNMIIGKRWPILRALIAILVVGGALAYVYYAPILGLVNVPDVKHGEFSEPLGEVETATIYIDASIGQTTLTALNDSSNLFEAEVDYLTEVEFSTEGTTEKTVRLETKDEQVNYDLFDGFDENQLHWTIGINPDVPIVLEFSSGVGEMKLDLSNLMVDAVYVNGGVGRTELLLPAQDGMYSVRIDSGVGEVIVKIADGAEIDLQIQGGVGSIEIDVPEDAGVELSADLGVGSVDVPGRFDQVSGDSIGIGNSGVWRSDNYSEAEHKIEINFDGGVGSLTIR